MKHNISARIESVVFVPGVDRLLLKLCKPKEKTEGGLELPQNAQARPSKGEVMAVHLDADVTSDMESLIGSLVHFPIYAATPIEFDGQNRDDKYVLVNVRDVLGVEFPATE